MIAVTALGALALQALALFAPQALPRTSPLFDRHLRVVRAERTGALRELLEAANDEQRERVARLFEERQSPGAPIGSRPPLGAIDAATRKLGNAAEEPATPERESLLELASVLDLMPRPGAFDATDEGRGMPITVRVYTLYPFSPDGDVEVSLWWVAASGERKRARTERVAPGAFRRPGFDLYVSAPLGPPARWRLELELRDVTSGTTVIGPRVNVPGIDDLTERITGVLGNADLGEPERAAVAELRRRIATGVRSLGAPVDRVVRALEGEQGPGGLPGPVPLFAGGADPADPGALPWGWWDAPPEGPPRATWLLLTPGQEAPEEAFLAGVPWAREAHAAGAALLSAVVGLERGERPADRVAEARRRAPDAPVVLILRGDALARLRFAQLAGDDFAADALVLSADDAGTASLDVDVPTLLALPLGAPAGRAAAVRENVEVARRGLSAFLGEAELPALVREWTAAPDRFGSD